MLTVYKIPFKLGFMDTNEVVALNRAIEQVGGQSALARACGVKQGHVWHWLNKSRRVPADHVLAIEAATGSAITRYELRPDIFGNPPDAQKDEQAIKKEAPGVETATPKDLTNAHILAQVVALEAQQHRAVREAILNQKGAADRLAYLDAKIAALRGKLLM
ncbi:MAG: hypothetical protein A3H32_11775 [Betaproteobacteria bacterium RIFCSPLOWO2_02_FULL_63_19]|nr:MAG: hypothetical protein A3H32_11775 [Betaproteobacteria bacterium RIFCSPLOWO2_02_FULL_63_19]